MNLFRGLAVGAALALSAVAWAGPVDVNTADAKTLETLDGIGPTKAAAIVEYRKQNGGFKSVDELGKVNGIGDKTVEALRSQITVGGARAAAPKAAPAKSK